MKRAPIDERISGPIVRTLEAGLSRLRGSRVRVREIQRRFSRLSSTFRTERLRVFLRGTEKPLRVFFKDLNPQHQVTDARAKQRLHRIPPRRELDMYRSILSRERFGTLDLYASRWEPGRGRFWLFLEDAGRTALNDVHDFSEWLDAVRWAARFHAATRDLPGARTRFLPRWTRAHYQRCANQVGRLLRTVEATDRDVLRGGLEAFTARLDWFSALPRCVIHGQFFGKNIMLRPQRARPRPRIAVIDWETAAVGPPAWDLASIIGGGWTEAEQLAMRHAYCEEYQAETGRGLDWDEFSEQLRTVAVHQTLEWLIWWGPHRSVPRRLKRFRRFLRELDALLNGRPALSRSEAEKAG
ncbi:MAG TPA: aminoglycoside phosphotransferase family protein [Gemmatimonadales bacterium]|nr:aminoglycoside phosphotransferase family protein [Gemmatimonadales bacterium]